MKTLLVLTVVLATALCAPTARRQSQMTLAEAQQLREVLSDLLRKSDAVNIQEMPAEMQGFWSSIKRGLGHALKLAHKGVQLYSRHIAPMLEQPRGEEGVPGEGEEPPRQYARRQQVDFDDYARFEQMDDDDYARAAQEGDEDDYALEQVLAALQQYDGEGLSKEAKAQFDFGKLLGSVGGLAKMFG